MPHRRRPEHAERHPVHVTMRGQRAVAFFRRELVFREMRRALAAKKGARFRVVHYSVQRDHVHLLVEASDRDALRSGMQGLTTRLARAVNRALARRGRVWEERYHRRDLRTPTEVRNAIVYVLQNGAKHGLVGGDAQARSRSGWDASENLDPRSSAAYFPGWTPRAGPRLRVFATSLPPLGAADCPVDAPQTWLLHEGWSRRAGLIDPANVPRATRATSRRSASR